MANTLLTTLGYTGDRRFQTAQGKFSIAQNTADLIPEGCPVKISAANTVSICTDADMPIGLCAVRPNKFYGQTTPNPTRTTVAISFDESILLVRATAAIAAGAEVMIAGVDTSATYQGEWFVKGITATTGKIVMGIALEAIALGADGPIAIHVYRKP